MTVRRTLLANSPAAERGCVATIGAYDGVHRGHQTILQEVKRLAVELELPSKVVSFEPMPAEFFRPSEPPARLSRFREKYLLLNELGLDEFVCLHFENRIRQLSGDEFIRHILVEGLGVKHLVIGDDFRFGANRDGSIEDLKRAGKKFGFVVTAIATQTVKQQRISSTSIRKHLAAGELDDAASMLGRHYMMSGRVVRGQQLGRSLGFPTANVPVKRRRTPMKGIFAVRIHGLEEGTLDGVANLGNRPTVGGGATLLEVFIFNFDRDIYGRYLDVDFVARLRDELKFPDLDTMVDQMNRDVEHARRILADTPVQ